MIRRDLDDVDFIRANLMGPSSIIMLEELSKNLTLQKGMRVLDLGCGTGLTSIYLAQKFDITIFAVDLWISALKSIEDSESLVWKAKLSPFMQMPATCLLQSNTSMQL
ncbi:SAM-dependent methyltransferase [Paenibacillus sp. S33]|uniref:SAM-dependent methyltransferase n=1 Tax=Paenibacillus polymyxa TaxID=1406 RepID=UPI002AB4C585|nr:class I SAM-dependent methyltransferase [Paenibacillus polymyxa]MDY7993853.1 class I SAM-dependent methyltransferase [Paenibacillus polymyxa]MDY8120601.1 class I SAM-dependent methyltransferase [Paenibacillus polymyxa]